VKSNAAENQDKDSSLKLVKAGAAKEVDTESVSAKDQNAEPKRGSWITPAYARAALCLIGALLQSINDQWPGNPVFEFITNFVGHLLDNISVLLLSMA
jgi:hypothetical protein